MSIDLSGGRWIFEPKHHEIEKDKVVIVTEPETDLWQRSYYGFRSNNAPALLFEGKNNFTLTVKISFDYQSQFDQCGLIIYLDCDNWFKASIEYENAKYYRLGSVVTNWGHSDWATSDIELASKIWYRLSRRGPDFLIESSFNGVNFRQMRIFHLHSLGETTAEMGQADPPLTAENSVQFGIYACSPLDSSFKAEFTHFKLEPCLWPAHSVE